ncbi:MAG: hypothetical protein EA398_01565 [Deltaproteobacteria bacterium]|nr:MAG: hypothetical protein EA398_01565 [Deltaproteobacteria bacterium]
MGRVALPVVLAALLASCDAVPRFLAQDPPEPSLPAFGDSARETAQQAPLLEAPPAEGEPRPALALSASLRLAATNEAWALDLPAGATASVVTLRSDEEGSARVSLISERDGIAQRFELSFPGTYTLRSLPAGVPRVVELLVEGSEVEIERAPSDAETCGQLVAASPAEFLRHGARADGCAGPGSPLDLTVPWSLIAEEGVFGLRVVTESPAPLTLHMEDVDGVLHFRSTFVAHDGWLLPNLSRADAPGPLSIRVEGAGVPSVVRVELLAPPDAGAAWLEREPNDSWERAHVLTGARPVAGILHAAEDVDAFRLAPEQSGFWRVRVEARTSMTLDVEFDDSAIEDSWPGVVRDEGAVVRCGQPLQPGEELAFRVRGTELEDIPAAYRILFERLVDDRPQAIESATDQVSVQRALEALALAAADEGSDASGQDPDEADAGPVSASAVLLGADGGRHGLLVGRFRMAGGSTWAPLEVTAPDEGWVSIGLGLSPGGPVPVELELRDEVGALVAAARPRAVGLRLDLQADVPAGRYFAVVGGRPPAQRCPEPWVLEATSEASVRAAEQMNTGEDTAPEPGSDHVPDAPDLDEVAPPSPPSFFD